MSRPPRFSLELTPKRRLLWQRAADLAVTDRQRNLAPWLAPLVDRLAEMQLAGIDPGEALDKILAQTP